MRWATCAAALAAAILTASTLSAQAPAPSANRAVAIGCLSQQQVNGRTQYVLTDTRNNPPVSFILDGDPAAINWHVGHTLEVVGSLSPAGTNAYNMKVSSVIYISNSCPKK
ncbi:MAG: hypothetical protein AB7O32_06040 [Vicinamibacterales bacterium]